MVICLEILRWCSLLLSIVVLVCVLRNSFRSWLWLLLIVVMSISWWFGDGCMRLVVGWWCGCRLI